MNEKHPSDQEEINWKNLRKNLQEIGIYLISMGVAFPVFVNFLSIIYRNEFLIAELNALFATQGFTIGAFLAFETANWRPIKKQSKNLD